MMIGTWYRSEQAASFDWARQRASSAFLYVSCQPLLWSYQRWIWLFSFVFHFYPIGSALSVFLIIALRTVPASSSMVVATFCNLSSSPGFTKPLITRHGHCEYSSSSPIFLLRYEMVFCCSSKMPSPFTFSCLPSVETGGVDVSVIVGFLAWVCFVLGVYWMLDVFFVCLVDGMLFK